MPSNRTLINLTLIVVAIGFGGTIWRYNSNRIGTIERLSQDDKEIVPRTHKLRPVYSANIERVSPEVATPDQDIVLRGTITSTVEVKELSYYWALPAGVKLISGTQTGNISFLSPDAPVSAEIRIRHVNPKDQRIQLRVYDKALIESSAMYNTLSQDARDQARRETFERGKQYLMDNPELLEKAKSAKKHDH